MVEGLCDVSPVDDGLDGPFNAAKGFVETGRLLATGTGMTGTGAAERGCDDLTGFGFILANAGSMTMGLEDVCASSGAAVMFFGVGAVS